MVHIIGLQSLLLLAWASDPEQRAADYLAREVPKWARENGCYSCHNNGDGARALFAARRCGASVPAAALADTIDWLRRPERWQQTDDAAGVKNAVLANIQYASALLEAALPDRKPLLAAAAVVARFQEPDGSWKVDADGIAGAPATYGRALATHTARRVLLAAGWKDAASRATAWLGKAQPQNVVDAAAIVLALPERRDAIEYLKRAQNRDGGWGETFDTAVAVLALHGAREVAAAGRGRMWLLRLQQPEGGWQETTRPPGGVSYAEHISTTAWVLYALVETGPEGQ